MLNLPWILRKVSTEHLIHPQRPWWRINSCCFTFECAVGVIWDNWISTGGLSIYAIFLMSKLGIEFKIQQIKFIVVYTLNRNFKFIIEIITAV
jgi:hypothetical protein